MLSHSVMSTLCNMKETCCVKETWTIALQDPLSMEFSNLLEWVAIFYSRGYSRPRD